MTILARTERPVAIRQTIAVAADWAGAAPTDTTPTFVNDVFIHAEGAAGGLFDPAADYYAFEETEALLLVGFSLKNSAGTTSWSLKHVDTASNKIEVFAASSAADVIKLFHDSLLVLLWGETFELSSVGTSSVIMTATLKFAPHQLYT
jgi:hypothetical protein